MLSFMLDIYTQLRSGFLPGIFSGEAKSIVMQISFVMLIFLLFSDQISGGGAKVSEGWANCLRGCPPVEETQHFCTWRDL